MTARRRLTLIACAALAVTASLAAGSGPAAPLVARAAASITVSPVHQQYGLDCEAASLQIALSAIGISVSQDWILNNMGADLRAPVLSGGNPVRWGDPYQAFVGHVNGAWLQTGYGVYYPPIVAAAQAAGAGAVGHEGWAPWQLYAEVAEGHPVVVRVPHLMHVESVRHWTAWDGRSVWYSPQDHAQVLIGFDQGAGTVTLADPFDGLIHTYAMSLFENRFAGFSSQAIVVSPPNGPAAMVATRNGDQALFWKGGARTLVEAWTSGGKWNPPVAVYNGAAAPMASAPSAALTSSGQQIVFWQGTDGLLHEMWWQASNGWNGPVLVDGGIALVSAPVVLVTHGDQAVFWQSPSGQLAEAWWNPTSGWNGPVYVPRAVNMTSSPTAINGSLTSQAVFWKGSDGTLSEMWWQYSTGWNGPVTVARGAMAMSSAPSATVTSTGEQIVIWQATDLSLEEATWTYPNWTGPTNVSPGPVGSSPSIDLTAAGEQSVFWRDVDAYIWTTRSNGNGAWSSPTNIGLGSG